MTAARSFTSVALSTGPLLVLLLAGCGGPGSSLEEGATFESLDGRHKLMFRADNVVDIQAPELDDSIIAGEYSILEDETIRIAADFLGTTSVGIYRKTDEGLVELGAGGDEGQRLYDEEHVEAARCEDLRRSADALIGEAIERASEPEGFTWKKWLRQVEALGRGSRYNPYRVERLQAGDHHALRLARDGCRKKLIWDSSDDAGQFVEAEEADRIWTKLTAEFGQEQEEIEARARREAARREEERRRAEMRRQVRLAESRKPTVELARFNVLRETEQSRVLFKDYEPVEVILTDVSLRGVRLEGTWRSLVATGQPSDSLWFGDVVGYIIKGKDWRISPYDTYQVRISIRDSPDSQQLPFATETERRDFHDRFKAAVQEWWSRYGDAMRK